MLELIFSENYSGYTVVNEKDEERGKSGQGILLRSITVVHMKDNRGLDGESGGRKNNHSRYILEKPD